MNSELRKSINEALSNLKEVNLRIDEYNQSEGVNEELEYFLDSEQKRLVKYLTFHTFGSNVRFISLCLILLFSYSRI